MESDIKKELFKIFQKAAKELDKTDLLITRSNGVVVESPYFSIIHKTISLIIDIYRKT